MGRLEEKHARNQPFFRPGLRLLDITVVWGCFLGTYLALRGVPSEAKLRVALYLLIAGSTFDGILSFWLLVNRAARLRWINPIHEPSWTKRFLLGRSISGLIFLVTVILMKRFVGWP